MSSLFQLLCNVTAELQLGNIEGGSPTRCFVDIKKPLSAAPQKTVPATFKAWIVNHWTSETHYDYILALIRDLKSKKMLSIKENSLKERTDNFRQTLDFNFEISHKKMQEKLNGLKKDVEFLRDNLSKSVQTVFQKKNDKNLKSSSEGKIN